MKIWLRRFLLLGLLGCAIFLPAAPDNKKPQVSTHPQLPPPLAMVNLPDVALANLVVTLVFTDLGNPSIVSHTDSVKVECTMQNLGPSLVPAAGSIKLVLTRDGKILYTKTVSANVLRDKGFRWTHQGVHGYFHDSGDHEYRMTATPDFNERTGNNNTATTVAREEDLHGTYPPPDLAITDFRVSKEINANGTIFIFTVGVENLSLTYIPRTTSGYIASRIDILKGNQIIAGSPIAIWPTPKTHKKYQIRVKSDSLYAGMYTVRAAITGLHDHESNPANNVSADITVKN
jgi:hypothetical protein